MNNQKTTFYIVRHGQSEKNAGRIAEVGNDDDLGSALSVLGKEQAKILANKFNDLHFDFIISSDLLRAKQTTETLALKKQMTLETTHLLRERTWGNISGEEKKKLKTQFRQLLHESIDLSTDEKKRVKLSDDMESDEEFILRVITLLRELAIAYEGKSVLIVSHGEVMRTLLVHLGYAKYEELPTGSIENTGYYILESDGADFFIKEVYGVNKKIIK